MAVILNGIRVLETASFVSGPYVGQLLADLGAEVIKIENPKTGDPFRSLAKDGYSADFFAYNTNKKSVGIDLTKDEGSALVKRLAQTADVLIENFRPGVMDRLKLSWPELKTLNPQTHLLFCYRFWRRRALPSSTSLRLCRRGNIRFFQPDPGQERSANFGTSPV